MQSLITKICGIDISCYNDSFIEKIIKSRMDATKCSSVSDYSNYLAANRSEAEKLKNAFNNNYSEFFRDMLTFATFERHILPSLISEKIKTRNSEIRIWSAACASGQEAYSIAILCDESLSNHHDIRFRIFASDISSLEIDKAGQGIFSAEAIRNVTFERMNKYFAQQGEKYIIQTQILKHIDFSVFDLLADDCLCPPTSIFGSFDVIFCANMLFYYKPEYQKLIVDKVDNCLTAGGWLIVGDAEKEIAESKTNYISFRNLPMFQKPSLI
jgi:chemotaxis methyl-accepting protein methylase